jgi:outer membrane immunogenic protein
MRQNYGFSLLPGFWLTDQVGLYARIGVARSNFSYSEYKDSAGVQTGMSDNQWLNGMRFGVGLTAPLSPNWQMRLDYSFLKYKTYVDTSFPMPAGQSRTIRLTPDSSQIELDFLYQFS